jgi:hypothetical protein
MTGPNLRGALPRLTGVHQMQKLVSAVLLDVDVVVDQHRQNREQSSGASRPLHKAYIAWLLVGRA